VRSPVGYPAEDPNRAGLTKKDFSDVVEFV
jgi:hypothetical protein